MINGTSSCQNGLSLLSKDYVQEAQRHHVTPYYEHKGGYCGVFKK